MYDTPPLNRDPLRLSFISNSTNKKQQLEQHTTKATPAQSIYGTPLAEITPTSSFSNSSNNGNSIMFHTPLSREEQLQLWREKRRNGQHSASKVNTINTTTDSKNINNNNKKKKAQSRTTPAPCSSSLGRPPSHRPSPRVVAIGTSTSSGNRGTSTSSPSFLLKRPSPAASFQSRSFSSQDNENSHQRPSMASAVSATTTTTTHHQRAPLSSSSCHKPLAATAAITTTTPTYSAASSYSNDGHQQRRYSSLLSRAPLSQRCPNDRSLLSQPAVRIPKLLAPTSRYNNNNNNKKKTKNNTRLSDKSAFNDSTDTLHSDEYDDGNDDDPTNDQINNMFALEHVEFRQSRKLLDDSMLSALSNSFSDNDDDEESITVMRHDPTGDDDKNKNNNDKENMQDETVNNDKQQDYNASLTRQTGHCKNSLVENETSNAAKAHTLEDGQQQQQQQQQQNEEMSLLESALATFEASEDFDWRKVHHDDLSPVAPPTRNDVRELRQTLTTERRGYCNNNNNNNSLFVAKKSPSVSKILNEGSDPSNNYKDKKGDGNVLDWCKEENDSKGNPSIASASRADAFRDENDVLDWRKDMDDDEKLSSMFTSSRRSSCLVSRRISRKRREALELVLPIPSPKEFELLTSPPLPSSSSSLSRKSMNSNNDSPLETPTLAEQDDSSAFDWRNCKSTPSEAKKQARRRTDSAMLLLPVPSLHSGDSSSILTPSPIPTPKLADTSVASKTPASVGSNDYCKASERDCMLSSPASKELKDTVSPPDRESTMQSNTRSDETAFLNKPLGPLVVKVNEKTLLCPISESAAVGQDLVEQLRQLQDQVDALMVEKKNSSDKLYSMRKSYEERVTPFRDLFDEQRKLRQENKRLVIEKKQVESAITALQTQMLNAVNTAVQKTKTLQAELEDERQQHAKAKQRNAELEQELAFYKEKCS